MTSQGRKRGGRPGGLAGMLGGLAMVLISSGSHALYSEGQRWPLPADGITRIPVCFQTSGDYTQQEEARLRGLVQEAIAATWGRWFKIEFSGFGECTNPPANQTLAIKLARFVLDRAAASNCVTPRLSQGGAGDIPDQCKHQPYHRGFQGLNTPTYGWLQLDNVSDRRAWAVVAHEVGHALAFEHEQSRPNAAGFCPAGDVVLPGYIITDEYDDVGIMNYCGPGSRLSWLDIRGAQRGRGPLLGYGTSPAGQWLNALPALAHLPLL